MAQKQLLLAGQTFNQLTVLRESDPFIQPSGQTNRTYLCKCSCGTEKVVRRIHLVLGRVKSCGCAYKNKRPKTPYKDKTLMRRWRGIRERCSGQCKVTKHLYHDRGITICEDWKNDFLAFEKWAFENGYSRELQIDRIDNNKGYSPDNCRFVTPSENMRNTRVTMMIELDGKKIPFLDACDLYQIKNIDSIRSRIKRGWDAKKALTTPMRKGNYKTKSKP